MSKQVCSWPTHLVLWSVATWLMATSLMACPEESTEEDVFDMSHEVLPQQDVPIASDMPTPLRFEKIGSLTQARGKTSFRFGAATAAAQIEDGLTHNDWYYWTLPKAMGGRGKSEPVGDAVRGATHAIDDVALVADMNLDAYRFSVDWSRIEPTRDSIDDAAIAHYNALIDALVAQHIKPMITVHHFSNPIWIDDFMRTQGCALDAEVGDEDLCGWDHPQGADQIIEELAEFAGLLAKEYGDRVDEWCTINEPINYIFASYGFNAFPPGKNLLFEDKDRLVHVLRNFLRAHVAIYNAIKEHDTIDADGDGVAADVGLSLSIAEWVPTYKRQISNNPRDLAARDRLWYVYHHLFPDALVHGTFDKDMDQIADEQHPQWLGKIDWLGVQYYFRAGVTGEPAIVPVLNATFCVPPLDLGSCLYDVEETHIVETMGYEYYEPGIYNVIMDLSERYKDLPLVVTEAGIATNVGARRAEHIVRTLEQVHFARTMGADVRGYYHWSLMDNFEWAEGYVPKFGLYSVDRTTFARTATQGAIVLSDISSGRVLTPKLRHTYGGLGPMTPEDDTKQ